MLAGGAGPGAGDDGYPGADAGPLAGVYRLLVDGTLRTVDGAWLGESLLTVLRERLGVTSVKDGCEQGRCGSCSVLLDGKLVTACTVLAADAADSRVTTLAGLPDDGLAPAVQAAFLRHGAVQCGFCSPGFVVAVTDLLGRRPDADEHEVREALAGNICRCTGYGRIVAAVRAVQEDLAGQAGRPGEAAPGEEAS
ncbi:(2Fe-2S)-binding protein [Frankia sp. CNm7]|uniref:(2Fe-2S)-binding protein n=1 Tax=Frankia nepalensis TaxID=1836974 RepID=A0A937RKJ9_9ACTN|nr:(2Fe-2S)-binding protein [Frankia nepalensis]MBL7495506.1 (2Fe-2S)-binding protein [Frankia nepalensis]MBL7510875.1 (2Fe-2S)-binding protein [Frankia nepalensis]MBL7520408.1 (2Fe-2S)-binding protein [Frankia nepalensis]MBL7630610.1 (2Fe-2S)-binding protein [Frankia nepalensis]